MTGSASSSGKEFIAKIIAVTGLPQTADNEAHILAWRNLPWDVLEVAFNKISYQRKSRDAPAPHSAKYFDRAIEAELKERRRLCEKFGLVDVVDGNSVSAVGEE